jgi:hypothetical protein
MEITEMRSQFELEEQGSLRGSRDMESQEEQTALNRLEMAHVRQAT